MSIEIAPPTNEMIARAAQILRAGGLVAMPTETVYGLAANAADPAAVAKLYETKGRPHFNPLIAHVANLEMAETLGRFSRPARRIARAFWPGPLTLVVDIDETCPVCDLARAGLDSLAIRVPAHPTAQALQQAFAGPLVAPSANPSGRISPTLASHVAADFETGIELILDGGPCRAGIESTIIDARSDVPVLLRPGGLAPEKVELHWPGLSYPDDTPEAPRAPGQLLRHYAPSAKLRLNVQTPENNEAYLGFGPGGGTLNLSPDADLSEAAANLFSMLRTLDTTHSKIAVAPIPKHGLGEAINDRLTRAAQNS